MLTPFWNNCGPVQNWSQWGWGSQGSGGGHEVKGQGGRLVRTLKRADSGLVVCHCGWVSEGGKTGPRPLPGSAGVNMTQHAHTHAHTHTNNQTHINKQTNKQMHTHDTHSTITHTAQSHTRTHKHTHTHTEASRRNC